MNQADRDKIRKNLVLLVEDMIVDEKFLMHLQSETILTNSQVEEIEALPTRNKKASEICKLIPRRGPNAFRVFLTTFIITEQPHLAEKLDPDLTRQIQAELDSPSFDVTTGQNIVAQPADGEPVIAQPVTEVGSGKQPIEESSNSIFLEVNIQKVDPSSEQIGSLIKNEKEVYRMFSNPRGRAVIVNNEYFKVETLGQRCGSSSDVYNMESVLKELGFEVDIWQDMKAEELMEGMARECQNPKHKTASAFVMVIMSHGVKGAVYGTDGYKVKIDDIMTVFDGNHCPVLRGKPKLFLIQACQGSDVTKGVVMADSGDDGDQDFREMLERLRELSMRDDTDSFPFFEKSKKQHEFADMLLAYSTAPGYKSWRHPEQGTWFLREFVIQLNKKCHNDHLIEILTSVRREVSEKSTHDGYVQITHSDDFLLKKLYFFPGYYA